MVSKDDTPTAIMDTVTTSAAQDKDGYLFLCTCYRCRAHGWKEVKEVKEGEDELFPWDDSRGPVSEREGRVEMRPIPERAEYKNYGTITRKGKDGHFNKEVTALRKKGAASAAASNCEHHREMFHR